MNSVNYTPSPQLLKAFRARLVMDGVSLTAWAERQGIQRQNLSKALAGYWVGPKAESLVRNAVELLERKGLN
jgi:lambda repressor-like predicted transcriptional regulator